MANVTFNGAEIYLDTRTTAGWAAVTRVIPKGFCCVELATKTVEEGTVSLCKMKIGDGVKTFAQLPYLGGDLDISQIEAILEDYYTKDETDQAISTAISGLGTVFVYRGVKATVEELPTDPRAGDVWLVGPTGDVEKNKYKEYYWNGTFWDNMGYTTETDLENYYTKTEVDGLLAGTAGNIPSYGIDGQLTDSGVALNTFVTTSDKLILSCTLGD